MTLPNLLNEWNKATADLPWGVQRTVHDALTLVSEEKITICYNADYRNGSPCLINAVGQQLTTSGGHGIPMSHFGRLVGMFDRINSVLEENGVQENKGFISPLAADILLKNFAPLKKIPAEKVETEKTVDDPYLELTDDQIQEQMEAMLLNKPTVEFELNDDFFAAYTEAVNENAV